MKDLNKINILKKNFFNSHKQSKKILKEIVKILINNDVKIINSIVKDTNKNYDDAKQEFVNSINIFNFVQNHLNFDREFEIKKKNFLGKVIYEPAGLVLMITPWNYPLITIAERLPFAIAAGCKVILKPSEYLPNFNKQLQKIFSKNKIIRSSILTINLKKISDVKKIVSSKDIDVITFVGSYKTAKQVIKNSLTSIKRFNLELGGKNPAILIGNDYDKNILDLLCQSIFENLGQCCVGTSRILVNNKIYDKFKNDFINYSKNYINENFFSDIIANKKHEIRVKKILKNINKLYRNNKINLLRRKNNRLCGIIIENNDSIDLEEEFFFPIVTLNKYRTNKELIRKCNNSEYGLACHIFSKKKINSNILSKLEFGRIWINTSIKKWSPFLPVGGKKNSGKGFDMGKYGYKNYALIKSIYQDKK